MAAVDPGTGLPPDADERDAYAFLGALGRSWWILLFLGVISLIVGILAMVWPGKTILVVAVIFAIWLVVSGIFQIAQSFAHGLSTAARVLLAIAGILSVILGLLAFRSRYDAAVILAIFIGIGFLFRGFMTLFVGIEGKGQAGRGWNIFAGVVMLIGGVVVLVWPEITLPALAWVVGIWLVVLGLFEIVGSFQLRSAGKRAEAAAARR